MKFAQNPTVRRKSAGLGIRGKLYSEISDTFVKAALAGTIPRINPKDLLTIYNEEEGPGVTTTEDIIHIYASDINSVVFCREHRQSFVICIL